MSLLRDGWRERLAEELRGMHHTDYAPGQELIESRLIMAEGYYKLGDFERMIDAVVDGLNEAPDHWRFRQLFGWLKLGCGNYRGWADLRRARALRENEWNGEPLRGKSIRVVQIEGYGDAIMHARFLPALVEDAREVYVDVPETLVRLFAFNFPRVKINQEGETDYSIAATGLGMYLADRAQLVPYLKAEAPVVKAPGKLSVALTWAGNPLHPYDRYRSVEYAEIAELLKVPDVEFVALQFGEAAQWCRTLPSLAHNGDFLDTANLLSSIDLLISVDTAVVHLAAAMGRPVWAILRDPIDWRWGIPEQRGDWYADVVRQFRNSSMSEIADALRKYIASRSTPL